jgi:ribosome-binding factor A
MATERMRRVNEVMREVVGEAIASELDDPRIGFVTVTAVETRPDLRSARVFVSVLGDERERDSTMAALNAAHGILQAAVNRELRLKRTPTLKFVYDDTLERAQRLSDLLDR